MTPDVTSRFVARLEHFRRRSWTVTFVRLTVALCGGVAVVSAGLLVGGRHVAIGEVGIVLGLATALALSFARFRRPALHRTASAVDAAAGLENCCATALQFIAADDAVARLIVRDAEARLRRVESSDVFPLDLAATSRAAFGLGAAGLGLLIVASISGLPEALSNGVGIVIPGFGGASTSNQTQSRARDKAASAPSGTDSSSTAHSASTARDRRQAATPTADAQPDKQSPDSGQSSSADSPGGSHVPQTGAALTTAQDHSTGNSASAGVQRTSAEAGDAPGAPAGLTLAAGRGGGVTSGSGVRGRGDQAGGARAGRVSRGADRQASNQPPADYSARYPTAAARAEQALAQDHVPAELRDVVRAYFTAIRP